MHTTKGLAFLRANRHTVSDPTIHARRVLLMSFTLQSLGNVATSVSPTQPSPVLDSALLPIIDLPAMLECTMGTPRSFAVGFSSARNIFWLMSSRLIPSYPPMLLLGSWHPSIIRTCTQWTLWAMLQLQLTLTLAVPPTLRTTPPHHQSNRFAFDSPLKTRCMGIPKVFDEEWKTSVSVSTNCSDLQFLTSFSHRQATSLAGPHYHQRRIVQALSPPHQRHCIAREYLLVPTTMIISGGMTVRANFTTNRLLAIFDSTAPNCNQAIFTLCITSPPPQCKGTNLRNN